jgi:hypothetical protein
MHLIRAVALHSRSVAAAFACAALVAGHASAQSASASGAGIAPGPGVPVGAHSATWTFDQTTTGQDIHWVSPTSVPASASVFNTDYAISSVKVTVQYIGITFGPFDVTDQIPPEQLAGGGAIGGPAPITIMSEMLAYPAPPEPPSVAALVTTGLDAGGFGFFDATNVVLGSLQVNLGFPFGTQTVQIKSVRITGALTIHATWFDLGDALAGIGGEPLLTGAGTLVGGEPMTLELTDARPGGSAFLVIGFTTIHAPLKGGVLVPAANLVLAGLPIDAFGGLSLTAPWPLGVPPDVTLTFQHWIPDPAGVEGFAASNGLSGVTP